MHRVSLTLYGSLSPFGCSFALLGFVCLFLYVLEVRESHFVALAGLKLQDLTHLAISASEVSGL